MNDQWLLGVREGDVEKGQGERWVFQDYKTILYGTMMGHYAFVKTYTCLKQTISPKVNNVNGGM